ncbi:RmlC-like cupin domain-containing protein [Exophiala viscosa]|uniref:RmlC-like cupin domain-containing protein n=1 Tax=Exophiala viscosa TaxID=2486360 RepID=A0AAN6E2E8_9EURO|nr:RmlC-like cupin domain-containing protein [Exophiala viscosa]KAI1629884.1 RmlC-like cupin domain-containing protein [Exophiala viscosa]
MAVPAPSSVKLARAADTAATNESTIQTIPPAESIQAGRSGNQTLLNEMLLAATANNRLAILNLPSDHVYDFMNPPSTSAVTQGLDGHIVRADRKMFPALIGNGIGMAMGFLGPCGFNTPHVHNRGAEMNIPVIGRLGTEFILENGATLIRNNLNTFQMTIFPQGAIHAEWNPHCTNMTFVAAFPSEDFGVSQIANRQFSFDDDLLEGLFASDFAINGRDIDQFKSAIPENVAFGVGSCLAACGISKR